MHIKTTHVFGCSLGASSFLSCEGAAPRLTLVAITDFQGAAVDREYLGSG